MKKALSALLTLALALSLAVCAFAKEPLPERPSKSPPTYQDMMEKMSRAAAARPSLNFELPVVTGIDAKWNGEVLFNYYWFELYFSSENVEITVTFDDGSSEVLTSWYGEGGGASNYWWWEIFYEYDAAASKVIFYYIDSNLYMAYLDTLDDPEAEYDWGALSATLPRASFAVPAGLLEDYLKNLPTTVLKLGESQKAALADGEMQIFAFTPEKSGLYYFYSKNRGNTDPYAYLLDAGLNYIDENDDFSDLDFGIFAELESGKTYYLIVGRYYIYEEADSFDVGVRGDVRKLSNWEFLIEFLTGGLFRWHLYGDYIIPGEGSAFDIFRVNMQIIGGNFLWSIIDFFYRIIGFLYRFI